jgi:hypothetical protein
MGNPKITIVAYCLAVDESDQNGHHCRDGTLQLSQTAASA